MRQQNTLLDAPGPSRPPEHSRPDCEDEDEERELDDSSDLESYSEWRASVDAERECESADERYSNGVGL
jgi:hypothetical protein